MGRCCLRGFADHLRDGGGENRWCAARPGRIFKQALDAEREKPLAPQSRHAHADVEFGGNLEILQAVSGKQNDAAALSDAHRNRTAASLPLKFFPGCFVEHYRMGNTHDGSPNHKMRPDTYWILFMTHYTRTLHSLLESGGISPAK